MSKKKILTSIARLMEVFDLGSDEVTHYLDTESGKLAIHSNLSGAFDEDGDEIKGTNPFHNKKYIEIPGIYAYEAFLDMGRFADTVKDQDLRQRLHTRLNSRNPVTRFKKLLAEFPREEKRWERYRNEAIRERVLDWLAENSLELKFQK